MFSLTLRGSGLNQSLALALLAISLEIFALGIPVSDFGITKDVQKPGTEQLKQSSVNIESILPTKTQIIRRADDEVGGDSSDVGEEDFLTSGPNLAPGIQPPFFYSPRGLYVTCLSSTVVLSIIPHENHPNVQLSDWTDYTGMVVRQGKPATIKKIHVAQRQCSDCVCDSKGMIRVNASPRKPGCRTQKMADICAVTLANLVKPTGTPVVVKSDDIQKALDGIPLGIRLKNQEYKYSHEGRIYEFTRDLLRLDPNIYVKTTLDLNHRRPIPGTAEPYYVESRNDGPTWNWFAGLSGGLGKGGLGFAKRAISDVPGKPSNREISKWKKVPF
ncbi:hypothetical protein ABW20_dc0106941 [Dactylellina cionopaga]|nr:hypothetical protein ABW20_dc0106941 [Dactylellina cionopaga]